MKKIIISCLIIAISCGRLMFAEPVTVEDLSGDTTQNWIQRTEQFLLQSIARDLVEADLTRLRSMANSLGLPPRDSAAQYQQLLAEHYGVTLIRKQTTSGTGNQILLERAGELRNFKVVEENDEILHVLGDVRLVIEDTVSGVVVKKVIEADELIINIKKKEIYGRGNVRYIDDSLEFAGTQFYYNYDINRGVLFNGTTTIKSGGGSGLEGMHFTGERVVQTSDDVVTLFNGKLTTCDEYDPHYYLEVSRLWINEDDEWGLMNGRIVVGNMPFFYIPIYYHPHGIEINPSLGWRAREGWFINLTYNLLGEHINPEKIENDTMSVASRRAAPTTAEQVFTIDRADTVKWLDTYYAANPFYEANPQFKLYPSFDKIDIAVNVFGDAYTNIGFYWGGYLYLKVDIQDFPIRIIMLNDFGLSRKVWKDYSTSFFTPYDPADISAPFSYDNTYMFPSANPLKFRTSQYFNMTGRLFEKFINLNYELQFEYVSGQQYFTDFYNRKVSFTYIDLLFDFLKSVQPQGSAFVEDADVTDSIVTGLSDIYTFIKFNNLSLKRYPDIYGLRLIESLRLDIESVINLKNSAIPGRTQGTNDGDPGSYRYLLSSFSAPDVTIAMRGVLADYDTFIKMGDKIAVAESIERGETVEDTSAVFKELFVYLDNVRNNPDTTSDISDTIYLTPVMSRRFDTDVIRTYTTELSYPRIINDYYDDPSKYIYQPDSTDDTAPVTSPVQLAGGFIRDVIQVKPLTYTAIEDISVINFKLAYSFNNVLRNRFNFNTANPYPDSEMDTLETLLYNLSMSNNTALTNFMNLILERYTISDFVDFSLTGEFSMFKIGEYLIDLRPKLTISYKKFYDDYGIYRSFLDNNFNYTDNELDSRIDSLTVTNQTNSTLEIYYNDVLTNNLSFRSTVLRGTGIKTNLKLRVFRHNELIAARFDDLNKLNAGNNEYETVDSAFYDSRVGISRIEELYTLFTLNFNVFQENYAHKLSFALSPRINLVPRVTDINNMLDMLLTEHGSDITYNTTLAAVAKEYLGYRVNGANLNTMLQNFYSYENFWAVDGAKNFRNVFNSFTIETNYSFVPADKKILELKHSFVINLENVGRFSDGSGRHNPDHLLPMGFYPDNVVSINLFNSLFTYSFSLKFVKIVDANAALSFPVADYPDHSVLRKTYDDYRIIRMTNTHSLAFTLPGNFFEFKLPRGNWIQFRATFDFLWDRNRKLLSGNEYGYYYLDRQTLSLSALMDILKINLVFRGFEFQNRGYGLELDNGEISLEYNVEEIPVFFNVFKLKLTPKISYRFFIKHSNYYSGSTLVVDNSNEYYSNNVLSVSFGFDLMIGKDTDYETNIGFNFTSANKRMYLFYDENGVQNFFIDLFKSFNFGNIQDRQDSNFNLQTIKFFINHNLHDWQFYFEYSGSSVLNEQTRRYYWENTFKLTVSWKISQGEDGASGNQLMDMFNKTEINELYEKGEWQQRDFSFDSDS